MGLRPSCMKEGDAIGVLVGGQVAYVLRGCSDGIWLYIRE